MTSFDVFAVVHELREFKGARIENIYQIDNLFLFVLRKIGQGKQIFLIDPEVRAYLTRFERSKPKFPPNFCMALRSHLRGSKIVQVFQPNFDRIIGFKLERGGKQLTMVVELFNRGSIIVVRENETVLMSLRYRKMRDRNILPGKPFQYPPVVGHTIFSLTREDLESLLGKSDLSVIRVLARGLNIGRLYAEEIIQRAKIDKDQLANSLAQTNLDALWTAIIAINSKLRASPPDLQPTIISNKDTLVDVVPFPLIQYTESESVDLHSKATMNEALDEYFIETEKNNEQLTKHDTPKEKSTKQVGKKKGTAVSKLEHQLYSQEKSLREFHEQSEQSRLTGSIILENLSLLEEVTSVILKARKDGINWDEINKKIQEGREKGIESAKRIQSIEPDQGIVVVGINGSLIELDFTKKVTNIAQNHFTTARKQKNKIKGAEIAIEKTKKRVKRAIEDSAETTRTQDIKARTIVELRKREWFEKFRWFRSSDGFLILAGKDVHTNEALVKRYMKDGDLFVHATVHGAPHTIIFAEGTEVPESTILESAQFAASFSSAWKSGTGSTDTYYVNPEQVSFTPQSGEYLVRGGVIIRGKKNMRKGIVLKAAVGILLEEKYARVIGGPPDAVIAHTNNYMILKPGGEKRGSISKQMRSYLATKVSEEEKEKVLLLDLNEFIRFIPGNSTIIDMKK